MIHRLVNETPTEITISTEGMDEPGIECVIISNPPDPHDITTLNVLFEDGRTEPCVLNSVDPRHTTAATILYKQSSCGHSFI